jgi:hypothetical protein
LSSNNKQEKIEKSEKNQHILMISNFPKDFTECQNSSSCNGQESSQPHAGRGMNITGHQGQGQVSQNGLPLAHIKEEPKEYGNYSNSPCQNR